MSAVAWYKVLLDGQSHHGGSLTWSLPKDGQPGEWHEIDGRIETCSRGLHLTSDPVKWFGQPNCKVYLAEGEGPAEFADGDKMAFRRARLIRELSSDDLVAVNIFVDRDGQVPAGKSGIAYGKSKVTARGNSQVTAWGNSQVTAWGNSQVTAWENSQVTAWGNSQVTARENSQVTAWGNSQVTAWGNSTISKPAPDCTCGSCLGGGKGAKVTLAEKAVLVDRSSGDPAVTVAGEPAAKPAARSKAKKKAPAKKKAARK